MTSLPWDPEWAGKQCRWCPHLLSEHELKLVSSEELNHREAKCTKCGCFLTNYRRL